MLSKNFTFHEAMKDSPSFRYELGQNERYFDRIQKRMDEMLKSIDNVIDHGQNYMTSLYNLTVSLNRLWLDLQIDEGKEQTAADTYKQMSDSLSQILYLKKSLIEHAYPSLRAGFESFLKREMAKLNEVKSHFDNLSSSLSEALSKKAAINRNKIQELQDAENSLTAIGTCFSHTGLDYVAQMNIVHALKCPVILETLWAFIKEHGNFFTRGAQFFADQQEFMVGDTLSSMRTSYKQIERRMQDRHTFVPKEIFQYPTGIPTDPHCIMEGYLFKRATNAFKTWNRRWFMIKEGKLLYSHKSNDGEQEVPTVMEENLKLCLVRPAPSSIERACCFELVTPMKNHLLQADSESLCNAWIRALQRTIQHLHEDDHGTYSQSRKSFVDSIDLHRPETVSTSSAKSDGKSETSDNVFINTFRESQSNLHVKNSRNFESERQNMKIFLKELLAIPGNEKCADCECENAKWTSLNLGIIICIECSGVHRSLGVHFSKVRSLTMDTLESEQRNILLQLGNNVVNSIFLKNLPKSKEIQGHSSEEECPNSFPSSEINRHSDREKREKWIKEKYVYKQFARSSIPLKAHSRSHSSLNPVSNGENSENPVKLRASNIVNDLNLLEHQNCKKSFIIDQEERTFFRNSFGSDTNLVQSARAAVACRESLTSPRARESCLVDAIRTGNISELFKWIVQEGFDLNATLSMEGSFTTLLHIAAEYNQVTMVEFLLLNGAKINNTDGRKNTALHLASNKGHTIIVYQLLKRNAEKVLKNDAGKTPLEIAVDCCHADICTLLRLHDMKLEFNDDQNSTMDETVESFIGDLAAKQIRKSSSNSQNLK